MNEHYTRAPHRSTESDGAASPNAALLVDFDNVTMAMRSNLGQELRNLLNSDIIRGKVSVQRAYADWRRYPQYIVPLSEASVDLIFAPAYGSTKKNATDIRLAIDAMELVFTRPEIGTFILLSGDSDFSSLVLKLKEFGKYVIGVGLQESSSDLLVQNCDEYYSYNSLSGLVSAEEMDTERHDPWALVEKAVRKMDERNDVMRSDRLKQVMLEFDSSFDEKDLGFSKFNRFLAEASSRGRIRLKKIGNGQYEVAKPAGSKATEPSPDAGAKEASGGDGGAGRSGGRRRPSDGGRADRGGGEEQGGGGGGAGDGAGRGSERPRTVEVSSLREAYDFLRDVVADLSDDESGVRDSEVKREMLRRNEGFDEAEYGFRKFSRFLRQAHDEGVVDLETDDDGNFHLSPSPSATGPSGSPGPRGGGGEGPERGGGPSGARPEPSPPAESGPPAGVEEPETAGTTASPAVEEAPAGEPGEVGAPDDAGAGRSGESGSADDAISRPEKRRRRGVGRFGRSSSRSSGSSGGGSGSGLPTGVGPVDEPAGEDASGSDDRAETTAASSGAGEGGETSSASRRRRAGLGRFRRGRQTREAGDEASGEDGGDLPGPVDRESDDGGSFSAPAEPGEEASPATRAGPGQGAEETPATEEGEGPRFGSGVAASTGGEAADVAAPGREDPVTHMVRNYPGVGQKTAEKLVEAFGDDVFGVMDEDPGRLSEVLPEHRARAVLEARESERDGS